MNISVGIMCYNEEDNIKKILDALLSQKTDKININEIIVVSSGSTDKTNDIVKKLVSKNKKIRLIIESKRNGKSHAINIFLKKAKNNILVLQSADTLPEQNTIENLCGVLNNLKVGIVSGKPIPLKNSNRLMNFVVQLQWELHHLISEEKPKFGELIAFRKVMKEIPSTAVDEEEIASIIKKNNLKLAYEPSAIVHNKGPKNIREFLRQRRRVYAGHLQLKKRTKYEASTLKSSKIFIKLFKTKLCQKNILFTIIVIMLEAIGRLLGLIDYWMKKNHEIWKVSESTKKL